MFFFVRTRFWRWSKDREEYEIAYDNQDKWQVKRRYPQIHMWPLKAKKKFMQALISEKNGDVEAILSVPFRPQLFEKEKPVVLNLSRVALSRNEVFLILVFIYGETKGQEKIVSWHLPCQPQRILELITTLEQFWRLVGVNWSELQHRCDSLRKGCARELVIWRWKTGQALDSWDSSAIVRIGVHETGIVDETWMKTSTERTRSGGYSYSRKWINEEPRRTPGAYSHFHQCMWMTEQNEATCWSDVIAEPRRAVALLTSISVQSSMKAYRIYNDLGIFELW